jgi:hypothetical protein
MFMYGGVAQPRRHGHHPLVGGDGGVVVVVGGVDSSFTKTNYQFGEVDDLRASRSCQLRQKAHSFSTIIIIYSNYCLFMYNANVTTMNDCSFREFEIPG